MLNPEITKLIPKIQRFFATRPVKKAWLFGSCSRGEENENSDIDILVNYDNTNGTVSLLKMGGMLMDLSSLLGRKVDLVDERGLIQYAKPSVDRDKILIYERND